MCSVQQLSVLFIYMFQIYHTLKRNEHNPRDNPAFHLKLPSLTVIKNYVMQRHLQKWLGSAYWGKFTYGAQDAGV